MTDLIVRGRYQIIPKGEDKPTPHTRVTNFAKKLDDGYTLTAWGKRMVLAGAAQRTDIIAATLAAGGDKRTLDGLAESAMDASGANVARETGTALHALCEQVDSGLEVNMPDPWRSDVAAYSKCLQRMDATVTRMEEVVVIPRLKLAGRFDRLIEIGGTTYVMDIKTGKNLSYSWLSIAIQLALYAQAETIYDPAACTHEPMPAVDQQRGLVVHLPAGKACATPYWVDLDIGRKGIRFTRQIIAWRSTKNVESAVGDTKRELRHYVTGRVETIISAGHGAHLASQWPLKVPTLKASDDHVEAQYNAIIRACEIVEAAHGMSFPDVSDPRVREA